MFKRKPGEIGLPIKISLNALKQRREKRRIALDNHALAKRLIVAKPFAKMKDLGDNYEEHKKYVGIAQEWPAAPVELMAR